MDISSLDLINIDVFKQVVVNLVINLSLDLNGCTLGACIFIRLSEQFLGLDGTMLGHGFGVVLFGFLWDVFLQQLFADLKSLSGFLVLIWQLEKDLDL